MLADSEVKSTRDRILQTLLTHDRCTIKELANAVAINPISVRHHINRLEAEYLVTSEENHYGVGRPRRTYFLTEKGRENFPTRYISLILHLLEQLKETMPLRMVNKLFAQIAQDMASKHRAEMEGLSTEGRLNLVKQLLANEGFEVEVERQGDVYHIRESYCPYYHVGQTHPEVCSVDQTLISTLLNIPVQKIQCILHGDAHCTYVIPSELITAQKDSSPDQQGEEITEWRSSDSDNEVPPLPRVNP